MKSGRWAVRVVLQSTSFWQVISSKPVIPSTTNHPSSLMISMTSSTVLRCSILAHFCSTSPPVVWREKTPSKKRLSSEDGATFEFLFPLKTRPAIPCEKALSDAPATCFTLVFFRGETNTLPACSYWPLILEPVPVTFLFLPPCWRFKPQVVKPMCTVVSANV